MIKPLVTGVKPNAYQRDLRPWVLGQGNEVPSGNTCMSGDAIDHVKDAKFTAQHWDDARRELMIVETQLAAHGLALQTAGIIPMHTDPEWILACVEGVNTESLR